MTDEEYVAAVSSCIDDLMEVMWEMEKRGLSSAEYAPLREARDRLLEVGAPIFKYPYEDT